VRRMQSNALRTALAAAVPVGLVLSAAVVWQSTSAAFTATTGNEGNSWTAGTVKLSTTTSALFSAGSAGPDGLLRPGSSRSRCLRVDYDGDLPATVKLYVTTPSGGLGTLDDYLVMSIEQGQNVTTATAVPPDCVGFPSTTGAATFVYNTATASGSADQTQTMKYLKTNVGSYADGRQVGTSVTQGTSLTFKITYWVKDDDRAQGTHSDASFVWQAQNVVTP
jgi:hypothetical protein